MCRILVYLADINGLSGVYCRYFAEEPFADITKVNGFRGVYFASQMINTTSETQMTLVTYDKGGDWRRVIAPDKDKQGKSTNCSYVCIIG